MKHTKKLALLILSSVLLLNCKKPSYHVGFNLDQEILKYNIAVQFCDAGDTTYLPEKEIFVKITGADASKIYESSGKQIFPVLRGVLNLGLHPGTVPTIANPVHFTIEAYGPDYLPVKVPVTIDGSMKLQRVLVTLVDLKDPPKGISVVRNTFAVDNAGALIGNQTVATPITPSTPEFAQITIPGGTTFLRSDGSNIPGNGSSLEVTTVYFSSRTSYAMNCFPGGSVAADTFQDNSGKYAGFQQSTGMVYTEMTLNGEEVKSVSTLLTYDFILDPAYISAASNAPIDDGEIIPAWNFNYGKKKWTMEGNDTVQYIGGVPHGIFHSDQIKYTSIGWATKKCTQNTSLTFSNGLFLNTTYLIDVFSQNGDQRHPMIAGLFVDVFNGESISNIPMPEGPVTIKVYDNVLSNSQFNYTSRGTAPSFTANGSACGDNITVSIPVSPDLQSHFFNVIGYCPNGYFYVFPTIPTYYKQAHTKANWSLLGSTHVGQFTTSNLRMQKEYHFLWVNGDDLFTKEKLIDSSTYTRIIPVPATMPGDTLRNMWCY